MATGLDETGTRPVRDVPTLVDGNPPLVDRRRQWAGTALLAAAGGLLGGLLFLVAYKGMPDDSYITLDYARNVVEHGHWGLTPFRDANSATSPLNVWLLAGGILVTRSPGRGRRPGARAHDGGDGGVGRSARRGSRPAARRRRGPDGRAHRLVADLRLGRRDGVVPRRGAARGGGALRDRASGGRHGHRHRPRGAHAPGPRPAGRRPRRGALRGRCAPRGHARRCSRSASGRW